MNPPVGTLEFVLGDERAFASRAAWLLEQALSAALAHSPVRRVSLALSGGTTPKATYEALAASNVDFARVDIFLVDDRAVTEESDRSNARMIRAAFAQTKATLFPMVMNISGFDAAAGRQSVGVERAGESYEATLHQQLAGAPLDIAVLGVGDDGHTASLFPGDPFVFERSRLVTFVPEKPGREARISLTAPVLEAARHVFVLARGESKSEALRRTFASDGSLAETPARLLLDAKGTLVWVLDGAALGKT